MWIIPRRYYPHLVQTVSRIRLQRNWRMLISESDQPLEAVEIVGNCKVSGCRVLNAYLFALQIFKSVDGRII